jgi:hypothetical protein
LTVKGTVKASSSAADVLRLLELLLLPCGVESGWLHAVRFNK